VADIAVERYLSTSSFGCFDLSTAIEEAIGTVDRVSGWTRNCSLFGSQAVAKQTLCGEDGYQ
jgi:hypothetical protein